MDAFLELALEEALWLQLVSPMLCHCLRHRFPLPEHRLNCEEIMAIARLFCDVVDFKSPSTSVHSLGVSATAKALAEFLSLPREEVKLIKIAGYFHDLGKLAVPRELLEKNDKLTEEERDIVKAHPYYTYDILSNIRGFQTLSQVASFHHERLDGSGYPFRLRGDEIPLGARILAVADVFSATREHRPYRAVMPKDEILKMLREEVKEGKLDPDVVQALIDHYEELEARFLDTQFVAMQRHTNIWRKLTSISLGM